jgi:hypothetical protein
LDISVNILSLPIPTLYVRMNDKSFLIKLNGKNE